MFSGVKEWLAMRAIQKEWNEAQEGKMGPDVKGIVNVLSGWKRIIMLAAFLANALWGLHHGDHLALLKSLFDAIGWGDTPQILDAGQLSVITAGVVALVDGTVKEVRRILASRPVAPPPAAQLPTPAKAA